MASERSIRRYRRWYGWLIRLHSARHRERFAQGMEQTFHDVCRERARAGTGVLTFVVGAFAETSVGIARDNMTHMTQRQRNILLIAAATASILLVPLVAMQFRDDVVWSIEDFVFAGVVLFGVGLAFELGVKRMQNLAYRAAGAAALGSGLLLLWSNLAVGLIGSEDERANLMYFGVLAVGIAGAFIARFQPQGMAVALFATAAAVGLVAAIALAAGMDEYPESSVMEILAVNGFFMVLFVGSGVLFKRASMLGEG